MRFLALDTETIRLPSGSRAPELCQIAMLSDVVGRRELAPLSELVTLDAMVDPEVPAEKWDEQAMEVHGIRPEHVAREPNFLELFPRIWTVAAGSEVLVGYNLTFDIQVLQFALLRYGLVTNFPWPRLQVDVMHLAQQKLVLEGKRGQKAPTLGEIYEHLFGRPLDDAHDALADVRATVEVWERLR